MKKLYSFYGDDGEYTKKEVINLIKTKFGGYEFEYTYGLEYRKPTTNHVKIDKNQAIQKIKDNSLVEVELYDEKNLIHVNAYSCNDMW